MRSRIGGEPDSLFGIAVTSTQHQFTKVEGRDCQAGPEYLLSCVRSTPQHCPKHAKTRAEGVA